MPERSARLVAWALVALTLAPLALPMVAAHGETKDGDEGDPFAPLDSDQNAYRPPTAGYTGPGNVPWINFYQGAWVYGQVSASPLGNQTPRDIHGWGDWLVWEDATSSDIFAFNIIAGTGQYITRDRYIQRNADVYGNVVVWEDYRNPQHADIWAYFFDTGESRLLSHGKGNHVAPSIDGDLVVWEDDRNGTGDIWGYNVANQTEFPIFVGPDREMDPLALRGDVYFRTYRFNVFDIVRVNVTTGDVEQITSDLPINGRPVSNGEDVFFLTQYYTAWSLDKYLVDEDRIIHEPVKFLQTTNGAIVGDRLVYGVMDLGYTQLVALNVSSGFGQHVSGSLSTTTDPWLLNETAYVPVRTLNGTTLLGVDVSPFAFAKRPEVQIVSPQPGSPWAQSLAATGVLHLEKDWGEPATFTFRVDDGLPQAIPFQENWRVTLDPEGLGGGTHVVTFRATFRDGPAAEGTLLLVVPDVGRTLDLNAQAQAFHAGRVSAAVNAYFLHNPASWFIVALVLLLLVLIGVRLWLWLRPKKKRVAVEYVHAD